MTDTLPLQALFLSNEIPGLIRMHEQRYRDDIDQMTVPYLASQKLDDLVNELATKNRIEIPVIDEDGVYMPEESGMVPTYFVPAHPMNVYGSASQQGIIYTFHIPYSGPQWGFYLKPMQYPLNMPSGRTTAEEVLFTYAGGDLTSVQINKMSTEDLAKVKHQLERLRNDIKPFNDQLQSSIRIYAGQKHAAALRQTSDASAIKWPIRTRPNATALPPLLSPGRKSFLVRQHPHRARNPN